MSLPISGPISLSQVNTELNLAANALISLNDPAVRNLAQVPSGPISFANLLGKTSTKTYTITAAGTNVNLRTLVNAMGYAGEIATVVINVNANMVSNSTAVPAVSTGAWPNGVTLQVIVNGQVLGFGGSGGVGAISPYVPGTRPAGAGAAGGPAMVVSSAISGGSISITIGSGIVNGGGGGGGGGGWEPSGGGEDVSYISGGSGGRGAGAQGGATAGSAPSGGSAGGSGGGYGAVGGHGVNSNDVGSPGGTGGAAGAAIIGSSVASLINWSGKFAGPIA